MTSFISEIFSELWKVWTEMFVLFMEFLPKAIKFVTWILTGLLILPCVFVAGNIYPKWADWGEKM